MLIPIAREAIPGVWPRLSAMLGKAIAHDDNVSHETVVSWLLSGESEAFWIKTDRANGAGVTTLGDFGSGPCCWINYVAGDVRGGPRAFVSEVRSIVDEIEVLARAAGCIEMRIGGRNWSRVFPGWERVDPKHPNRMRKRLPHG